MPLKDLSKTALTYQIPSELFSKKITFNYNHMTTDLKSLIEFMSKSLVDTPDEVSVSEVSGDQSTVYELKVNKSDLGKVIGKQGRTARALRTILNAASTKMKKRTILEIIE